MNYERRNLGTQSEVAQKWNPNWMRRFRRRILRRLISWRWDKRKLVCKHGRNSN